MSHIPSGSFLDQVRKDKNWKMSIVMEVWISVMRGIESRHVGQSGQTGAAFH